MKSQDFKNICIACKKEFLASNKEKYCSKICEEKDKETRKYNKICSVCKKDFKGRSSRSTVCDECYYITIKCLECKRLFSVPLHRKNKAELCSYYCRDRRNQRRMKEKNQGLYNKEIRNKVLEARYPWLNESLEFQIIVLENELKESSGQRFRYIQNSLDRLKLRASGEYQFIFKNKYEEEIKNSKPSDYWIYGHLYNGKIYYIGQTKRTPMIRYVEHLEQRQKAIKGNDIRFNSLLEYEKKTGITDEVIKNTEVIILDKISKENMTNREHELMLNDAEQKYIQAYKPKMNFYYINLEEEL